MKWIEKTRLDGLTDKRKLIYRRYVLCACVCIRIREMIKRLILKGEMVYQWGRKNLIVQKKERERVQEICERNFCKLKNEKENNREMKIASDLKMSKE